VHPVYSPDQNELDAFGDGYQRCAMIRASSPGPCERHDGVSGYGVTHERAGRWRNGDSKPISLDRRGDGWDTSRIPLN
jgi:hypothetical protein